MDEIDDYSVFGAYVYPNMLIDISPTVAVITRYVPRSATHTTIFTDYLFPKMRLTTLMLTLSQQLALAT